MNETPLFSDNSIAAITTALQTAGSNPIITLKANMVIGDLRGVLVSHLGHDPTCAMAAAQICALYYLLSLQAGGFYAQCMSSGESATPPSAHVDTLSDGEIKDLFARALREFGRRDGEQGTMDQGAR